MGERYTSRSKKQYPRIYRALFDGYSLKFKMNMLQKIKNSPNQKLKKSFKKDSDPNNSLISTL